MTTKEYLEQCREDVPEWLKAYQPGKSRPLADFLNSRIVYYPGSGFDGDPVEVFGASHSAHCFVYADYWLSEDNVRAELRAHGFRGYNILDEVSFSGREVMSAAPWRQHFLSEVEQCSAARGTAQMRAHTHPEPYALLVILARKPSFGDDHGPERCLEMLEALGLEVIDELDVEAWRLRREDRGGREEPAEDPLRLYMRQMGRVELLTPDEEVGRFFNVTRERVRQIESKALRKLRHPSRKNLLSEYFAKSA